MARQYMWIDNVPHIRVSMERNLKMHVEEVDMWVEDAVIIRRVRADYNAGKRISKEHVFVCFLL